MNVHQGHPDMLRPPVPGVPAMHQGLMSQQYMQQHPQQGQQPIPHNMSMLQNNPAANPGLRLMAGQPGNPNPTYSLNMQAPNTHPRAVFIGNQHSNGQGMNPTAGAGPSHMGGLPPGGLQSMAGLSTTNMQTLRRVQSQPMVQGGPHMPGMQPSMIGAGMSMGGPPGMRGPMPQQHIQQMQIRHIQQQQAAQGGGMPNDMGMPMNRPAHMQGGTQLPPHARNQPGQQLMSNMQQPSSLSQGHGMQQQMQHPGFGTPMSISPPHQQPPLGASPHVGSSGQQQQTIGGTMAGNPIAPQGTGGRGPMPNEMFMFPNSQLQQRMPMNAMNNTPFNIPPSTTPINAAGEMSQRVSSAMDTSGPLTPAQVIGMGGGGENYPNGSFPSMGQTPTPAPPRPPSHNGPHNGFSMSQSQPSLPSQQSPRQPDHHPSHAHPGTAGMPRPQSQPQVVHRQSPIPPGTTRTPRVSQQNLPMNSVGVMQPPRVPTTGPGPNPQGPPHHPTQPPPSAPPATQSTQIAQRPNTGAAGATPAATPTASTSTAPAPPQPPSVPDANPPPQAPSSAPQPVQNAPTKQSIFPVGFGQCIGRILQFSGYLSQESKDRLTMPYWQQIVQQCFSEKATMKLTLWKDNQQVEAKPFEIGFPIFARFFLVTAQSGVKSQTISLDGARERMINTSRALVECATAAWTFRYTNGYSITLRGPLTAEIVVQPHPHPPPQAVATSSGNVTMHYTLLFERLQFDAFSHDKYLSLDALGGERITESPRIMPTPPGSIDDASRDQSRYEEPRILIEHATIPAEPINAFGIPQATMRCLELAESVAQMSELIQFSVAHGLGPLDALKTFAERIRKDRTSGLHQLMQNGMEFPVAGSSSHDGLNGAGATGLGASSSFGPAGAAPGPPPRIPGMDGQAQAESAKQAKAATQQSQASGSTPSASTPASAPTPGGPTTPSMANASLKRKAPSSQRTGEDSPTTANSDQQPNKRAPRKRGRTNQGS